MSLQRYDIDYQWVDEVPDAFVCLICTFVASDPQQALCCGRVFCKACLEELSVTGSLTQGSRSRLCPQCRIRLQTFPDRKSDGDIKSLDVYCNNTHNGCKWTGELRALEKHMSKCEFELLICPNSCGDGEAGATVLRKDMERHQCKECPRRWYICEHCSEPGEYQERTTTHLTKCPDVMVLCPNEGCGESILRCKVTQHRRDCPFEEVPCKYARIGCEQRVLLKDHADHENDDKQHLHIAVEAVHQHQIEIDLLKKRLTCVSSQLWNEFTFKLTNYTERKHRNEKVYSPPFYSHLGGYKLCLSVFPNGEWSGQDHYVSLYVHLMCGEHDDQLIWPFTGSIVISLLNQIKDEHHLSETANFYNSNEAKKRVVGESEVGRGFGWEKFICHSLLYSDDDCQYLQDDSLYLKVKVDKTSEMKPWLVAKC